MEELLELTFRMGASDLHLLVSYNPTLRINGKLRVLTDKPIITSELVQQLIFSLLTPDQKELFLENRELDFSYSSRNAHFRINIYYQRGTIAGAFRLIPARIRTIDELNLPKICHSFTELRQGFILVTGPTGHGKSTSIASMIDAINQKRSGHIVTIEDPIEYIYPKANSIVSQREIRLDTYSWERALRSALREDIDVVLVGEMRDHETIASALTIAETGHLVFATLHTNSAAQTIDRIVDVFPSSQQTQIRLQLALTLAGVMSQRLIPTIKGDRTVATEILLGTDAVKTTIREGKTHLIENIIQTSKELGMLTLESSLSDLVRSGTITLDTALEFSLRPDQLLRMVK